MPSLSLLLPPPVNPILLNPNRILLNPIILHPTLLNLTLRNPTLPQIRNPDSGRDSQGFHGWQEGV